MINYVVLVGRMTHDPEMRYTPSGVPVVSFQLAVDRARRGPEGDRETDFIRCVVFGQGAEFLSSYGSKGRLLGVEGRLQVRRWVASDGQQRTATEVVAYRVQLLDRRPEAAIPDVEAVTPAATEEPVVEPAEPVTSMDDEIAGPTELPEVSGADIEGEETDLPF